MNVFCCCLDIFSKQGKKMSRVVWKGAISFGLVHIPVILYPGEQRNELSFDMLDKRDMAPIGYRRYNKNTGKEIPWEQIVKGYEYEDGKYVVLSDEDFRRANVEATQTVDIVFFVEASEISPVYFEQPYYLVPGKKGEKGYALLREALRKTHKVGIAKVVIHTRQHLAAVIPERNMLILNILRFADELRDSKEFEFPSENLTSLGVSKKELEMAQQLIEGMQEKWNPKRYHDDYRQDILALIKKKVASGETEKITEPEPEKQQRRGAEVIDMMALLKRSLETKQKNKTRAAKPKSGKSTSEKESLRKRA
jgi:DNA end-binding protein Ku